MPVRAAAPRGRTRHGSAGKATPRRHWSTVRRRLLPISCAATAGRALRQMLGAQAAQASIRQSSCSPSCRSHLPPTRPPPTPPLRPGSPVPAAAAAQGRSSACKPRMRAGEYRVIVITWMAHYMDRALHGWRMCIHLPGSWCMLSALQHAITPASRHRPPPLTPPPATAPASIPNCSRTPRYDVVHSTTCRTPPAAAAADSADAKCDGCSSAGGLGGSSATLTAPLPPPPVGCSMAATAAATAAWSPPVMPRTRVMERPLTVAVPQSAGDGSRRVSSPPRRRQQRPVRRTAAMGGNGVADAVGRGERLHVGGAYLAGVTAVAAAAAGMYNTTSSCHPTKSAHPAPPPHAIDQWTLHNQGPSSAEQIHAETRGGDPVGLACPSCFIGSRKVRVVR